MTVKIPWAEKYRPTTIEDLLLPADTKKIFKTYIDGTNELPNMIFSGQAGVGKTSMAKIFYKVLDLPYLYLNCSDDTGIDVIRTQVKNFCSTASFDDKMKYVLLDEMDRLSPAAQDMLKGLLEQVHKVARFVFTCNSPEKIIAPLKSRAKEIYFKPVDIKFIGKRITEILKAEKINVTEEQRPKLIQLIKKCYPDIRKTINHLEYFSSSGDLEIEFSELISEDLYEQIIDLIKKKKLSELRGIMRNNKLDYNAIIKHVFSDVLEDKETFKDLGEGKKAQLIVLCADYIYKSNFIIDLEVNFAAFAIELMGMLKVE